MTEEILKKLMEMGLSNMEGRVYVELLSKDSAGGYQIAKEMGVARSCVYPALESLCSKGFASVIPGEPVLYMAVKPEEVFPAKVNSFKEAALFAEEELKKIVPQERDKNLYVNIHGLTNIVRRTNEIISSAKKEILISAEIEMAPFLNSLKEAVTRGVRIVIFSWGKLDLKDLKCDYFTGEREPQFQVDKRLLIVADAGICLTASNNFSVFSYSSEIYSASKIPAGEKDFLAMTSHNRLIVNIVMEHIHFDIYLRKLRQKTGGEVITPDIQIGSLMEKGLGCSRKKIKETEGV